MLEEKKHVESATMSSLNIILNLLGIIKFLLTINIILADSGPDRSDLINNVDPNLCFVNIHLDFALWEWDLMHFLSLCFESRVRDLNDNPATDVGISCPITITVILLSLYDPLESSYSAKVKLVGEYNKKTLQAMTTTRDNTCE